MNQSPRIRFSREDRIRSADLQIYGHYNRFQASNSAPSPAIPGARGLLLATAAALLAGIAGCAAAPDEPVTDKPTPAVQEDAGDYQEPERSSFEMAETAPERYVVKKGDTLWDISAMFLKDPWLWPEIWYTNPQIQNPHLIYPGDIITIYWYEGQPQMRITRDGEVYTQTSLPTKRLRPQVRTRPLEEAIPTIPIDAIRAFLGSPRIIDEDVYEDLPYILRSRDGRLMIDEYQRAYVRVEDEDYPLVNGHRYNVIRLGDEYEDPQTGEDLGYQAIEIAKGVVVRAGDPGLFRVTESTIEAHQGDRLLAALEDDDIRTNFIPHAPVDEIRGQIIDVIRGVENIAQFQIVTLNRGARDGLEPGHVLDIYQRGEEIDDPNRFFDVQLPDERAGTLMVFRVQERISYALVMEAFNEVHVLDIVRNP